MASNLPERYQDLTPATPLSQSTLNKVALRSMLLQSSFNYERMQAGGFMYGVLPALKQIHANNKADLVAALGLHLEFFNTNPLLAPFTMGMVLNLECQKALLTSIRGVKTATMGPLGGIGDSLIWFTYLPLIVGITARLALVQNPMAPFLFLILFNAFQLMLRFGLLIWTYKQGIKAVSAMSDHSKEFTRAASILGVFVVGGLVAVYAPQSINFGHTLQSVTSPLLALLATLGSYVLMTKCKWSATRCMLLIFIIVLVCSGLGIFSGI